MVEPRLVFEIKNLDGIENYNLEYITAIVTNVSYSEDTDKTSFEFGWAIPVDSELSHEQYLQLSEDLFNGTILFTEAVDSAFRTAIKN